MNNQVEIYSVPIRTLFEHFIEELEAAKTKAGSAIVQAADSIDLAERYLGDLREYIMAHPFANDEEEIVFFKIVKPAFTAQLHYHLQLHSLLLRWPIGSKEKVEQFLLSELDALNHFFNAHSDFYRYYRSEEKFLDSYYFLRNKKTRLKYFSSSFVDIDHTFSTGYDLLAGKLQANDLLIEYLQLAVEKLQKNDTIIPERVPDQQAFPIVVPWKASVVDLAELIISLHAGNVFGDPKWTLNRAATVFSQIFGVKLSNISKLKTEISLRKRRAQFLEQRINDLNRTLEEEDEKRL